MLIKPNRQLYIFDIVCIRKIPNTITKLLINLQNDSERSFSLNHQLERREKPKVYTFAFGT